MHLRAFGTIAAGLLLALPTVAKGQLALPGQWIPFLERLEKDEFLAVEHVIGGTLSDDKPELLIYRAAGKEIETSYAVLQLKNGDHRLVITLHSDAQPRPGKTIKLPPTVATPLLAAFKLALTTQLYPPTGQAYRYPSRPVGSANGFWINLRVDETASVAGVVLVDRCMTGRDSYFPFLDVMYQLSRFAYEDDARPKNFAELSTAIEALKNCYSAKQRRR